VNNAERNKRALILLAVSLLVGAVLEFGFPTSNSAPAVSTSGDPAALQLRLSRLRQIAATAPVREVQMKQVSADLADRERGMIQADTAAQAQATLLEIASRIGQSEQLDVRGGDFAAPRVFGDYGMVYATISFECHVEQLVNFLADLSREPQLVAPAEERIAAANPKDKTMTVRMVLAGVVAKKLVPEKKGLGAF
jgi:uncharacterized membrane protein